MSTNTNAPQATEEEVNLLCAHLRGKGWRRAAALVMELPGWDDRKIRAAANAAGGKIISGQNGYRLTCEAPAHEIETACAWLKHQATAMTARAEQIAKLSTAETRPTQSEFFAEPSARMDERQFLNRKA